MSQNDTYTYLILALNKREYFGPFMRDIKLQYCNEFKIKIKHALQNNLKEWCATYQEIIFEMQY